MLQYRRTLKASHILQSSKAGLAAGVLALGALTLTGCANMTTTATDAGSLGTAAVMNGNVKGGNQPVSGATVQLYGTGTSGVGSLGILYATTTTDANGSFSFIKSGTNSTTYPNTANTYSCGTGTDRNMYIKISGGNTLNNGSTSTNSAAAFLAAVANPPSGNTPANSYCSQISNATFVNVSEVTTVATVAALAQFINPSTETIGNDGIGEAYVALNHAFSIIPLLVGQTSGLATASTTIAPLATGVGVAGVTVTATPESAKLNTIANIISSCVNQQTSNSTSNCSTLFANALPPASASTTSQPNQTLPTRAADTIQATLFLFLNPTSGSTSNRTNLYNLQPGAAPYQPTISAVPTDWTLGINYVASGNCATGAASGLFLAAPADMNVDASGNIWIANNQSGTLAELSPTGVPTSCVVYGGSSRGGGVVDTAGNIWFGDFTTNNIYRYTPSTKASRTYTTAAPPYAITADGSGDIFFNTVNSSSGAVYIIKNAATTDGVNTPSLVSNQVSNNATRLFPDAVGDIWVSTGSSNVTQLVQQAGQPTGYATVNVTVPTPNNGIVVDSLNRVYNTAYNSTGSVDVVSPNSSGVYSAQSGFPLSGNPGGTSGPVNVVIDGSDNMWIANQVSESSGQFGLSEINISGTALSASGSNGGFQKSSTYLNQLRAITIDLGGNVWVSSDGNPNAITELVGAASPLYQPYSTGLSNGRFQTIP